MNLGKAMEIGTQQFATTKRVLVKIDD